MDNLDNQHARVINKDSKPKVKKKKKKKGKGTKAKGGFDIGGWMDNLDNQHARVINKDKKVKKGVTKYSEERKEEHKKIVVSDTAAVKEVVGKSATVQDRTEQYKDDIKKVEKEGQKTDE